MILDDNGKVTRINVRQLGTVPVATSNNPFLSVIIVGTREEVSKNEFGIPETFLLMHFYRNPTERAIVLDGHGTGLLIDGDGDGTDLFGMERVAVDGVDEDFIKDFQEGWGVLQVLLGEGRTIEDPVGFCTLLDWTDV